MLRVFTFAVACVVFSGLGSGIASAKHCRDAHGKFMKCPPAMAAATTRCRDAKGKFTKCSAKKK